ncbi:MAG: DUF4093 domain-containing protein [Oscillospiraceae bacterium]|nr:DUF4093 domain-containing protein [Oscillospiraceae bacterium]
MIKIKETIIVEGRYDKSTIANYVDANIIETSGFGIFSNSEKLALIRILCEKTGVVILTDSDGAGFVIRNYLKGSLPKDKVKHAYIPQIEGREKRKKAHSAEGYLGVEGMGRELILKALSDAGVDIGEGERQDRKEITKADFYADGLSGRADSAARRGQLQKHLGLPSHLTANALLSALNIILGYYDYKNLIQNL